MSKFIIRILGGVPLDMYHKAVAGRQAVIDGLRKDIAVLDKRIETLSALYRRHKDE